MTMSRRIVKNKIVQVTEINDSFSITEEDDFVVLESYIMLFEKMEQSISVKLNKNEAIMLRNLLTRWTQGKTQRDIRNQNKEEK